LQVFTGEHILFETVFSEQGRSIPRTLGASLMYPARHFLAALTLTAASLVATGASAQVVVYRAMVPMFAPAAGPYVANYTPAGNYAAVTAFSPPAVAMPVAAAPVVTEVTAPALPVTSYYAPAYVAPTYATPVATTAFYAPAAPAVMAAPVVAPVTTYYAPAAVAVPLYRRGLFGAYRPVRAAYYPYY
jgi:hypothetical protein